MSNLLGGGGSSSVVQGTPPTHTQGSMPLGGLDTDFFSLLTPPPQPLHLNQGLGDSAWHSLMLPYPDGTPERSNGMLQDGGGDPLKLLELEVFSGFITLEVGRGEDTRTCFVFLWNSEHKVGEGLTLGLNRPTHLSFLSTARCQTLYTISFHSPSNYMRQ